MKIGLHNNHNMSFDNKNNSDIENIMNVFNNGTSLIDIVTAFNHNKDLHKVNANYYTMRDYALFIAPTIMMHDTVDKFKALADSRVSCAPLYMGSTKNSGGQYSLLVLKVPELKEDVSFIDNKEIVSFEQRAKFVEELERLHRQQSLYNPLILDNPEDICVTKDDRIYFDDWSDLDTFQSEAERSKWFNSLRELLNLETY